VWLDEPTRRKFVVLCGGEDQRRALLENFAPDQLAREFGGSAPSLRGYRERAILEYEYSSASPRPAAAVAASAATVEELAEREERAQNSLARCHDWYSTIKSALRKNDW
jgi:hypothetical protein